MGQIVISLQAPSHPTLFFSPSSTWNREYPSKQRETLPVCLCQPQIWVTDLLSSFSLTNQRERSADTLNERICVCTEIWTVHAHRGRRLKQFSVGDSAGPSWKWPCMNCCPVFLYCSESTVICPP